MNRKLDTRLANFSLGKEGSTLLVDWIDGSKSSYAVDWLIYQNNKQARPVWHDEITIWAGEDFKGKKLPHVSYDSNWGKSKLEDLTRVIAQYGFCFVEGLPACPKVN